MKKKWILLTAGLVMTFLAKAQYVINGYIFSEDGKNPIENVHVVDIGNGHGTTTNEQGYFTLEMPVKNGVLQCRYIGFQDERISYKISRDTLELGRVYLKNKSISLEEITIGAGIVQNENAPITISTISSKTIQNQLGDRPLPLILNTTPGLFSVRVGGGSGDAEMSIRGFGQDNIGVLLNGIPINGVENGLVYWSNWLGLGNTAAEIQIQKGPGYSNMAVNSVGGSVNIITKPASFEKGGSISYQMTTYGNQNFSISLNSGKLDKGWSISVKGSYTYGPGYIDATYVKGWSYFMALGKQINKKNRLTITLLGAPQVHGQRTLKLSNRENELYGQLFNKDWGSYNGEINNASENFYKRPFLGINHYLSLDENKKIANSVYLMVGSGGGKWSESFNYAPTIFEYRNPSDQIDWQAIYNHNATNQDKYVLQNGDTVTGYSYNVQTNFLANHVEAGFMSTYEQQLNDKLSFTAGVHYRFFKSHVWEEITNLLGGKFYIEDYSWAVDGDAGRNQIMTVGDVIKVDNNAVINFINAYSLLKYTSDHWNAFVSANGNSNWYQRIDSYNYVPAQKSEVITKPGYDFRAGAAYHPSLQHTFYTNGAFVSKAPYFKYVFGNFTNVPVQNLQNENIATVEAGYRFNNDKIKLTINGFYTEWQNVSLLSNEYVQLENDLQTRALINGLNALHKGAEAEFRANLYTNFKIGGYVLLADYRWQNNVTSTLYNNENVAVDTVNVYAANLYVGGAPQQQFSLFAEFRLLKFLNLRVDWTYYNKIYAGFSPVNRSNPNDTEQPFQLPAYNLVNAYLSIPFNIFQTTANLQVNAYNLLNADYIEWGEDGINHDLDTFRGFWSFGRTFDFMLRINF